MTDWKEVKLNDVCKTNIQSYTNTDKWDFVHYLDTGNITNNCIDEIQCIELKSEKLPSRAKRKVVNGDIVYSTVRPNHRHYGIIKKQPINFLVSTGFAVLSVEKTSLDSSYLYYYLTQNHIVEALHSIGEQSASTYPSIKPSDITNLQIPLPPLAEQKSIASILSSLDDKIENNNAINKNLEEQAQAIFKSWFVDFEPFTNGEFEDSELGKIPKGWRVGTLGEVMLFKNGKKRVTINGEIPIYGGNGILGYSNSSNASNVIIIGRVGAYCGSLYFSKKECWISDNAISCQSKMQKKQGFCFQQLKALQINTKCVGSAQPLLTQEILNSIELIIPNDIAIEKYDNVFENLYAKIDENLKQNEKLTQLRDSLLPKLMSGEVRVPVEVK